MKGSKQATREHTVAVADQDTAPQAPRSQPGARPSQWQPLATGQQAEEAGAQAWRRQESELLQVQLMADRDSLSSAEMPEQGEGHVEFVVRCPPSAPRHCCLAVLSPSTGKLPCLAAAANRWLKCWDGNETFLQAGRDQGFTLGEWTLPISCAEIDLAWLFVVDAQARLALGSVYAAVSPQCNSTELGRHCVIRVATPRWHDQVSTTA